MTHLDRIDWNLLPALDALLTERNVSRAARRLNTSQPTASGMLARLRRHFDDELLVRQGNAYALTPLAERLAPLVRELVSSTRTVLERAGQFDPVSTTHRFTLGSTEYGQLVLGPTLLRRLRETAPGIQLSFANPFVPRPSDAEDILTGMDGWLGPREGFEGSDAEPCGLLSDRWMCVVDQHHPVVGAELTLADVGALPWVASTVPGGRRMIRIEPIRAAGVEPRVEVVTDSFAAVPFLVAGTERIGLVQGGIGTRLAQAAGVRLLECPWTMPPLHLTMWWHPDREDDPAHVWLRAVVESCMAEIAANPVGSGRQC